MTLSLLSITRYPVKGLSPEDMASAVLSVGEGLPLDRAYALMLEAVPFDPRAPQWLPKTNFLMLAKYPRLAKLSTRFDAASGVLSVARNGKSVAAGNLNDPVGRAIIEDFFDAYMDKAPDCDSRVVCADGHMFSDHRNKVLSLLNTASLADLERTVGAPVDPLRFRGNLLIEGGAPWEEFDWVGQTFRLGCARLEVTQRIDRCAATNVNLSLGETDMNIPRSLRKAYGHIDFGVYAKVIEGGPIRQGDQLTAI